MEQFNIDEAIDRLNYLLKEEIYVHNSNHIHERELRQLLGNINNYLLTGYDIQRKYIVKLLSIYEGTADHVLSLLLSSFLNSLEELKHLSIKPLDLNSWEGKLDVETLGPQFESFVENNLKENQAIRLSEDSDFKIDADKGNNFLRLINRIIAHLVIDYNDTEFDITATVIQLWAARNIAIAINKKEFFYFILSIFMDRLHYSQNYQFARDMAEEALVCSYKDGIPEYGYYLSFKVFSSTSSSVAALHYGNVANALFKKRGVIYDYVLKNYYWEAIKFARNIQLYPIAIRLFENRPKNLVYSQFELNKFYNAYYSSLLYTKAIELPGLILGYIDQAKESIIKNGEHEALPWLAMLFNIKKNYPDEAYDTDLLGYYHVLFKRIISKGKYDRLYNMQFGNLEELSIELKKNLLSLTFTRNQSDFVTDNKVALGVSHRNILKAFEQRDIEGYLLSMILQSDFSIVFKEKHSQEVVAVQDSYIEKDFEKEYYSPEFLKQYILSNSELNILWLGTDQYEILPVYFNNQAFTFINNKQRRLIDEFYYVRDALQKLPLNTRLEKKNGEEKLFEDYLEEEHQVKKEIIFFELPINPADLVLIIKDIELSAFPHNLITTQSDFISNCAPVSNIFSLEFFLTNRNDSLPAQPNKSIWIPVDSGDMPLSMMYSKMEDDLVKAGFAQYKSIYPNEPLNADINILVAHGNEKISTFPAFYLTGEVNTYSILNFDHIVEKGKILILFICHSGSEQNDLFRNQTITIVKEFLQSGYQAVIAPFWALHIDIPPIWLPEFLNELHSGATVSKAFFQANKKVSSIYNTPKAYACLHLYGNPFLKIS